MDNEHELEDVIDGTRHDTKLDLTHGWVQI